MIRAWLILSTLVFSSLFKAFTTEYRLTPRDPAPRQEVGFPYHSILLSKHTFVYYVMEHINAIIIAVCLLIKDDTPKWMLWLFVAICVADLIHFRLFYTDDGIGFNLIKVIIYGIPTAWMQIRYLKR